jgi:hypothetical protein
MSDCIAGIFIVLPRSDAVKTGLLCRPEGKLDVWTAMVCPGWLGS